MYVHSVKLVNYRSLGDYPENEVIIEPRITAIIGKNESGKSNVLSGLSQIQLLAKNDTAFSANNVNRNCPIGTQVRYEIVLRPLANESFGTSEDTLIILSNDGYSVSGGFRYCYGHTIESLVRDAIALLDAIGKNPFKLRDNDLTQYNNHRLELLKGTHLNVLRVHSAIVFLKNRADTLPIEQQTCFKELIEQAYSKWVSLCSSLPHFFYRAADKHLRTTYKLDEVEKELKNPTIGQNSLLREFVKVIDIPTTDFISAVRDGTAATQASLRSRIRRKVKENVTSRFCNFYEAEEIDVELDFNNNSVSFMIRSSNGEALMLSERSNGLKWYLETFIDATANDVPGSNVVYLLDEPGISLHVNAQNELLNFFNHLADQGNQVVYTTHLPHMLNTTEEGMHRIRAVVKDNEGYTRVYKTAYDSRIAPDSQEDTLAPIINALGMNLNDAFGPAQNKINIVTEGISDYIYLHTMSKLLPIDTDKYTIIPAVGASNCINICTILHGWGCKYIAVFDYDLAGVESGGERLRKDFLFEMNKQYCYMKDVSQEDVDNKTYKKDRFMVEDVVTAEEIERFCNETNTSKTMSKALIAKAMSNAIESGQYTCGEKCLANFGLLFDRIFACSI